MRYLSSAIKNDMKKKMVFISGPRQVGKTTLSLNFVKPPTEKNPAYLNWDIPDHRKKILKNEIPIKNKTIIFDEIHKYKNWRALMKGLYDGYHSSHSFLVTGSGRLDYFSKGGDSLAGRYFHYRLHPFSLLEMNKTPNARDLKALLQFGGFPEPLFNQSLNYWKKWQNHRNHQVINEDLRDLEKVKEISLIHLLLESLLEKTGSPLSINSVSEDLQVSHQTVVRWLKLLEALYVVFLIPPYGSSKIRAVKKEQKLYFWDWSQLESKGVRFENLVASHLLKYCHYHYDTNGDKMELRYLRDTDKREIDFIVIKNKIPLFAVECKTGEKALSPHLKYFKERTSIPLWFQVHTGYKDYGHEKNTGRVLPFTVFSKDYLRI